jgi:hypothetical protein
MPLPAPHCTRRRHLPVGRVALESPQSRCRPDATAREAGKQATWVVLPCAHYEWIVPVKYPLEERWLTARSRLPPGHGAVPTGHCRVPGNTGMHAPSRKRLQGRAGSVLHTLQLVVFLGPGSAASKAVHSAVPRGHTAPAWPNTQRHGETSLAHEPASH